MATLHSEQTADMERAIACLALEVPAEVWEDVRDKWHAARDRSEAKYQTMRSWLGWCIGFIEQSGGVIPKEAKRLVED